MTGEDLSQSGDSFSAKFYKDGTLVETFSGTVGSDGSLPLGLVKLKQGTYSVELSSGGTTLTPFKAVVKPSPSNLADTPESQSTFQKLPQSASEQLESTGNAPLPKNIELITEDDKLNSFELQSQIISDLPKSEKQPLANQRSFLTADQINGQKSVILENAENEKIQDSGIDSYSVKKIGEDYQGSTTLTENQPLLESSQSFSTNTNLEQINLESSSKNNSLTSSQDIISTNAELPSSTPFGLSQDGRPISQNTPLGYTPDGVPVDQKIGLDANGLPISQNRPLDSSVETFSGNSPLVNDASSGALLNDGGQVGIKTDSNAEYQKLPESNFDYESDNFGNLPTGNASFESFDEIGTVNQKLENSASYDVSQNNKFSQNESINFSENQKLTDSAFDISGFETQGSNADQQVSYQKLPQTSQSNLNDNSNNSQLSSNDSNITGEIPSQPSGQTPGKSTNQILDQTSGQVIGQTPGQTPNKINTQLLESTQITGQKLTGQMPTGQTTTSQMPDQTTTGQTNLFSKDSESQFTENDSKLLSDSKFADGTGESYQTRTLTSSEYSEAYDSTQIEELFNPNQNRILSSTIIQQNNFESDVDNPEDFSNIINQDDSNQIDSKSEFVQIGEIGTSRNGVNYNQVNNFDLSTDLPNDFYEYKGSRNISNEELLEEYLASEEFTKLDEDSKTRVITARQEIQSRNSTPTQIQQDNVISGTVLSGGQPIQNKTNDARGFAKLFSRNKQDRSQQKEQDQVQKQFEESNSLKQKVSLTLDRIIGNNKFESLPEYSAATQQVDQYQNINTLDSEDDTLQSNEYQFGDEDNIIYKSPRITGVRETLDNEYQEELKKRRRKRRNLKYLPVGSNLEPQFLSTYDNSAPEYLDDDQESNIYRGLVGERGRFQELTISEQEQNKIALRKAEHDIQQQLNKALEENIIIKENAENQSENLNADSETLFYRELVKERERFQQSLAEEREQNKAALRRSEEQIQRQLVEALISNPQATPTQAVNDPISQVVRSLVESGKDKEEVIIDATRIIQMIQNNQTVSGGQEIDEYLLRQRIERELKYEFKQMQLEHEMKMKLIYRRMIEDMYVDMLNS